jgi:hypothetical protein
MWWSTFAVRIAVEEPSVLERLPVSPEILLETPVLLVLPARQVRQVRPGIPEILRRFLALEKIPYVITPFNV